MLLATFVVAHVIPYTHGYQIRCIDLLRLCASPTEIASVTKHLSTLLLDTWLEYFTGLWKSNARNFVDSRFERVPIIENPSTRWLYLNCQNSGTFLLQQLGEVLFQSQEYLLLTIFMNPRNQRIQKMLQLFLCMVYLVPRRIIGALVSETHCLNSRRDCATDEDCLEPSHET